MAKKLKDDGLVMIVAHAWFKHDGVQVRPNDLVRMKPEDAAELVQLRFARYLETEAA